MTLADRIVVMRSGEIEQIGSASDIYHFPETTFVAQFTGNPKTNLLEGSVRRVGGQMSLTPTMDRRAAVPIDGLPEVHHGQDVILNVRPEDVVLELYPSSQDLKFVVYATLNSGPETLVYLQSPDNTQFVLRARSSEHLDIQREQEVAVRFRRGNIYDRDTLHLVDSFGFAQHPHLITGRA
jgi:ABC-type sugar transport system ATPase subunit